jgi:hypothetical protein
MRLVQLFCLRVVVGVQAQGGEEGEGEGGRGY